MTKKLIYFKLSVNSELPLELAPGRRLGFLIIYIITLSIKLSDIKYLIFFNYPLLLQCMEKNWVIFSKNKSMRIKCNIKNDLSIDANVSMQILF